MEEQGQYNILNLKEKSNTLYFVGIILLSIKTWLFITKIIEVPNYVHYGLALIIALTFVVKIASTKYTIKEYVGISIISVILIYTFYKTKDTDLILTFLPIVASKGMDINKILKILFKVNLFIFIIHILYHIFCVIFWPNNVMYVIVDNVKRVSFFMRHPNYAGAVTFWLAAIYIFLNYEKKLINNVVLLIICAAIMYCFTVSRTTLIAFFTLILLLILVKKINIKKILYHFTRIIFIFLAIISIFFSMNYFKLGFSENELVNKIDTYLSGRIKLSGYGYYANGSTIFGKEFVFQGGIQTDKFYIDTLVIDSFYVSCLIYYGVVYLVIIAYFVFVTAEKCTQKDLIFLIVFSIIAFSERYIIYVTIAFPLLLIGNRYLNRNKELDSGNFKLNKEENIC